MSKSRKNNNKKQWYNHYLLDLLNNLTKFPLNQIRTQHFELKLFNDAVPLKYGQGQ